jgi:hypothetical protein
MKGRSSFTRTEIAQLRALIRDKQTADRGRQKVVRAKMRAIGLYITDFADYSGFSVSDFDDLVSRGLIAVTDEGAAGKAGSKRRAGAEVAAANPWARGRRQRTDASDEELGAVVRSALGKLRRPKPLDSATVSPSPGLYAIYGDRQVWLGLGLAEPPDKRPLYVGKAEDSLVSRDLDTHFGDGRTGSSTVRRSFAALLHDSLGLQGIPRNVAKPGYFTNYGLSPEHDALLTAWMKEHLGLAVWPKPKDCPFALKTIETALLAKLLPPLNLQDVVTPWTAQVKAARSVMAEEARR